MATKEQNRMPNEGEPGQKQTRTFSQENEVIEKDSDSESEVDDNSLDWSLSSLSDDGFGTGADRTFDELTSWNCLMLPFFDGVLLGGVRRNLLNILMKGILFVQEMYDENWSLMETFHEKVPEKYDFLFKRGDLEDSIIFQGSAAEGLVVYRIEKTDPGTWWNGLRHARESDYDIMHVNNDITVLDNTEHYMPALNWFFTSNSNGGREMEKALKLWKEAEFCLHEKEPWVMLPLNDKCSPYGVVEHVTLTQPACKKCVLDDPMKSSHVRGGFFEREFNLKTPYKFWSHFSSRSWKRPNKDHDCDEYHFMLETGAAGLNHNRYGDLCLRCQDLNSTTIKHEDGSLTHIFLDQVFKYGPSSMKTYYIDNKGKPQYGFPLFNDMGGKSSVYVDNIPALKYPLLDWNHYGATLAHFGIKSEPELPFYRWPYECMRLSIPNSTKSGWPSLELRIQVLKGGCHLVPKNPMRQGESEPATNNLKFFHTLWTVPAWRISFSLSEKILAQSFTMPQRRCFLLVKSLFRCRSQNHRRELDDVFGDDDDESKKLFEFSVSGFMLKHVMFWTLEEVDQSGWRMNNLFGCVDHILNKLDSFLDDMCIPHYFFGKMKNLLAADFTETKDEMKDGRNLFVKCANMRVELKTARARIFPSLVSCAMHGHLDYQWTESGSDLLRTFLEVVRAVKVNEETRSGRIWWRGSGDEEELENAREDSELQLKSAVIAHHQTMLHLIKEAPRKYGRGVNQELATFLSKEVDALTNQNVTLNELHGIEMADLEKSKERKESPAQSQFWQNKAQMYEKYLEDFVELRKKAISDGKSLNIR